MVVFVLRDDVMITNDLAVDTLFPCIIFTAVQFGDETQNKHKSQRNEIRGRINRSSFAYPATVYEV